MKGPIMRIALYVAAPLLAMVSGGSAVAANICRAEKMTCATNMPVDGYCECTAHGVTQGGTVVSGSRRTRPLNATAGGCGDHPGAPGCR